MRRRRKRERERRRGGPYCCDGVFHTYAGFIIRAHCFAVECIRAYDDFWGDKRREKGGELTRYIAPLPKS